MGGDTLVKELEAVHCCLDHYQNSSHHGMHIAYENLDDICPAFCSIQAPLLLFQLMDNILVTCLSEQLKDLNKADATSKSAGRQIARHIL